MELKLASYAIATARAMNEWDARERVSERGKGEENLKNTIISNWMMWKKWKNQQSTSGWGNSASERSESANCCVVASAVRRRNNLLTRSPGRVRFLSSHDIICCHLGRVSDSDSMQFLKVISRWRYRKQEAVRMLSHAKVLASAEMQF